MKDELPIIKGRGAAANPRNRFDRFDRLAETPDAETSRPATECIPDRSRSVIVGNRSPDIGFEASINAYRGCEHGCSYCYARPTHEYLGYSAGLDFETKILVKADAPALLRAALSAPKWRPTLLAMSGVTDPYQPIDRKYRLTRRLLAVLLEFRNPVVIITKNAGVIRDRDLLAELAGFEAAAVFLSITTLDEDLQKILEPRTSPPQKRMMALSTLAEAGVPCGLMLAPVIPGLTDEEIPKIVAAATEAGAAFASMFLLRLPSTVARLFEAWLAAHLPDKKERVLNRIRNIRKGRLNDPAFFSRMQGSGPYAAQIADLFNLACRKAKIKRGMPELSTRHFRHGRPVQQNLFSY